MLAVIEKENLGPAEIGTNIYGAPCYVCGDKYVFLGRVYCNEAFDMTYEEMSEYYEYTRGWEVPDTITEEPYIMYDVFVQEYEKEYNQRTNSYYWNVINPRIYSVDHNGDVLDPY